VTSRDLNELTRNYPMGYYNQERAGLYYQLAWAAKLLNRGYYLWKNEAVSFVSLSNGTLALLSPRINAGTAAVQYMLGVNSTPDAWEKAVSEDGVYQTYTQFFGIPFDLAVEPLFPVDLAQPELILPFEKGIYWSLTGGPHASWGDGSAWGALDFAPPGEESGCFKSDSWVTAAADGVITRSAYGAVVLDLDGDGLEQTGWSILYMHIASLDRVQAGKEVKAGDRIGHPSCEGGISDGTHVHIARRYNGEWISADTELPYNLSGWVSSGEGIEYSGTLTKDGKVIYSWNGRTYDNQIRR
jgi:murein DD-endopeptidase MepM/ murein hydrolase activator NlpD